MSGITVVPRLNEKEAKAGKLLKDNFGNIAFETFQPARCHRDFSPNSFGSFEKTTSSDEVM